MDKKEQILYQKIMRKIHRTDQRQPLFEYLKMFPKFLWDVFVGYLNVPMKVTALTIFILGIAIGYFYYNNNGATSTDALYNNASYTEVLDGNE